MNTIYLTAAQVKAVAALSKGHDNHVAVSQEDLLTGQPKYQGHVLVEVGFPAKESVHLDREGNEIAKEV